MTLKQFKGKWKLITAVVLGICIISGAGWYYFRGSTPAQTSAVTVAVERGTIKVSVSATGTAEPVSVKNVSPKASGTIKQVYVKDGQRVKKGDLLFKLDDSSVVNQIDRAQLDIKQLRLDIGTTTDLINKQQIYAPISGKVTSLPYSEGQDISSNAVLMTIQNSSKLKFLAPFNAGQITSIKVGQKADVTIPFMPSIIPGKVTKVDYVGTAGTDGSRVYNATVEMADTGALSPGLEAQASVHTSDGIQSTYGNGTLEWETAKEVRPGVSGTIEKLYAELDSNVKQGQKLAVLGGDSITSQMQSQKIKLQQAQLNIANLQSQLADYNVIAPVDGIVTIAGQADDTSSSGQGTANSADPWQMGDEVRSGQTLATIEANSSLNVTVPVDETDITKVKLGQKANITFDALPDQEFQGLVNEIGDQGVVQNNVANFNVTVSVISGEGVKQGMTANVEILVDRKNGVLTVPIEAVQERQGRKFVFIPGTEATSGNKRPTGQNGGGQQASSQNGNGQKAGNQSGVTQRMQGRAVQVETGLYNESDIEIISGLNEGDRVVLPTVVRSSGGSNGPGGSGTNSGTSRGGFGMGGGLR